MDSHSKDPLICSFCGELIPEDDAKWHRKTGKPYHSNCLQDALPPGASHGKFKSGGKTFQTRAEEQGVASQIDALNDIGMRNE